MDIIHDYYAMTDEEIAGLVQQGDTETFGILVERYGDKLTRYARKFLANREDIEDLVQEVFMKAYTNIQSFTTSRKFSPWLYRIAHNEFINAIKKKRWEPLPFFDPDTLFPHPLSQDVADRGLMKREVKELVEQHLNKLDAKYREPLVLYYLEGLDYTEISEVLQLPVSTVGVRLKRGKEMMKKYITETL
ncbi:MAG: RNA polymerase sigma factor [Patescibacteria group bacterium]